MENISTYITEKLKLNKDSDPHNYHPKTKEELVKLLNKLVRKRGQDADLNDIDTSAITDMSYLFAKSLREKIHNIDISDWDVSNVKNMDAMFSHCKYFDCDLSNWDVHNVERMGWMFDKCETFKGTGVGRWDISNVIFLAGMFGNCIEFNENLGDWKLNKNIDSLRSLFYRCYKFEGKGLEKWNISHISLKYGFDRMFNACKSMKNKPSWYKK